MIGFDKNSQKHMLGCPGKTSFNGCKEQQRLIIHLFFQRHRCNSQFPLNSFDIFWKRSITSMPYTVPHLCMVMICLPPTPHPPPKKKSLFFFSPTLLTGLILHLTEAAGNPKCIPKLLETAMIAGIPMRKDGVNFSSAPVKLFSKGGRAQRTRGHCRGSAATHGFNSN